MPKYFNLSNYPGRDLLLLLEELSVEQGNLLAVRVGEAPQRRLVRVVQLRQEVTLLEMEKRNYAFIIRSTYQV